MARRVLSGIRGNLIAFVALVVALGGTAYAAGTIGANDLKEYEFIQKGKQVKPGKTVFFQARCPKDTQYVSGGYEFVPGGASGLKRPKYLIIEAGPNLEFIVGNPVGVTGYGMLVKNSRKKGPGNKLGVQLTAICLPK